MNNAGNNGTGDITKANQWVMVNGRWQYNDSMGNTIKSMWFYDRSYGKSYYLQADGNMATGWITYNGNWYYLGYDGAKKTGWQLVNGAMAYNTIISGYKLGSNGAWIR